MDTSGPRNDFVVYTKSGHPGYTNYVVSATSSGLRDLAARLERLAKAPVGERFDVYVTRRGEPKSLGSLAFVQCDWEQLVALQQPSASVMRGKVLAWVVYAVIFAFAVTGWLTFFGYMKHWLGLAN